MNDKTYEPRTCAICGELESASEAWKGTHRYGPVEHGPFIPATGAILASLALAPRDEHGEVEGEGW